MEFTGGGYLQIPFTNSEAIKRCMTLPTAPPSSQLHPIHQREPRAPFATNYGRKIRPSSAPIHRVTSHALAWRQKDHSSYINQKQIDLSKMRPFQDRKAETWVNSTLGYPRIETPGPATGLPQYDALHDPHLNAYYTRKFSRLPRPPSASGSRSPRRKPVKGGKKDSPRKKGEVLYKVAVTTADKKGAGTSAKVFVRLKGTKGKFPKKHLTKKAGSVKSHKSVPFKFGRGTTHVFKLNGPELGELKSLIIEHDGLTEADSWYLESVEVVNTSTKKTWLFHCGQWLSLHKTDGQMSRELFAKRHQKTEYEVVVVTGNQKGGGTDANISVTIHGKSGTTGKIPLKNNSKDCFERNQSDIFHFKSPCVGPLTKIRIEHDNTGFAPGWYLDRVVVSDMNNPKWKYYFPCGLWLAKDEGDGQTFKDLLGSRDPMAVRKSNKYKVTVYTGNKRGAGTNANVFITLFGEHGDSGERKLDTSKDNFERGKADEFVVEGPCLGPLSRVRIGHDNSGPSAGWFLDKVIVDDLDQGAVYEFPCERWFAKDEDDGQISRDLVTNVGAMDAPPGVPYVIHVVTGDVRSAGTSARVYVVLYGGKKGQENSGKIWLENGKFERGRTDIFTQEVASMLSPLSKIEVGHDNSGAGAGWFLEKVIVNTPSAGTEQVFPCGKWLADDEGDGLIERTLNEALSNRKERKKLFTWFTWITTSDIRGAGTDANVYLVVYGNKGKSDVVKLDNQSDNFEAGEMDKFKIELSEIGRPYKLRVGHDNSGSFAGWHLDKIELEDMSSKDRYTFLCNKWLAEDEDDGEIIREIPAEGPGIKKPQPVVQYTVEVHTGKKRGAGTDANVFLEICGEQGDTGERPLRESKTNRNKFEKGNVDEFIIEAVTLKKLTKIRVGHDGKGSGDGWFLDKIVVRPQDNSKYDTTFECCRWLAIDEDDGAIVREITAGGSQMLSTTSYHVSVKTGDVRGAGTDANVNIQIFGKDGDTGLLHLKSSDNTGNKFERARTDLFKLEATDIGKIERIKIGHDGAGPGAGWFLDEVRVDVPSKGMYYLFACHRWLAEDEGDGLIEIELDPTDVTQGKARIPYEVTVWTGDVKGAGTDANIFLQMYGENGKTEEYQLRNRTDNFEQGQMDIFKIEAADVGPLQKVRIGHDGKGMFAGWHMDKLRIQRYPSKQSKRRVKGKSKKKNNQKSSKSKRRKSSYSDDDFDSEEEEDRDNNRKKNNKKKNRKYGSESESEDISEDERDHKHKLNRRGSRGNLTRQKSFRNDKEDDDEGDRKRKNKRTNSKTRKNRDSDEENDKRGKFKRQSSKKSLHSQSGDSDDEEERGKKKKKNFRRKLDLESEDEADEDETEDYWFICNRWFAKGEDDGKIVRELVPTDEQGNPLDSALDELEYEVTVFTGDIFGAGTDANVYLNLTGENGDTGERHLATANNINKFERNQEDIFKVKAIDLGPLKKLKIRHDNSGIGGAPWFLGHIEVKDPKNKDTYFFPCQRWLAKNEDDGQIARELVPVDKSLKKKLSRKDSMSIRKEIALETKAAMTTYHVYVHTSDLWGAGTDANVHIFIFGEKDDTGIQHLKASKTNKDKFERNQMDEFVIEAVDIGDIQKIKIGHDNSGLGGGAWHLDRVEIDAPSLGKKWLFPCGRWLAKNEDDGLLERELFPQEVATEECIPCIPYEITVFTTDMSGAGTDADVFVVLYGKEVCTQQKSLCPTKKERKKCFERACEDKFVIELEDVGDEIEKIRIGHDGSGFGAAWHLNKVEIRRLKDTGKGSTTYAFPCNRWLARNEDDGAIVRELVPDKITEEVLKKDGTTKTKEIEKKDKLQKKNYLVNVYTGDVRGGGTDANVFITIFGDQGDTGERKLHSSETHRDKFERNQVDKFSEEAVDLGKVFKIKIRHDNSMLSPAWFLDRVEVVDVAEKETYTFYCERWLGKNKDDGKIERSLFVKGYEGDMMSSTSTLRSGKAGSVASLDSVKSGEPFSKSPRMSRRHSSMENIPEGPTIPYTIKLYTGDDSDNGTESNVFINIKGPKKKMTGKMYLELAQKKIFEPGSIETFSIEAVDVGEVKQIEIGHDGVTPGSGWFLKEVEIDLPTKGKHYFITCKQWLARDKGDGKTMRPFSVQDGDSSMLTYKPLVPCEVTIHTGDCSGAGTDAAISMTVFGENGSSEVTFDKASDRFERAKVDLIKVELDDIGLPKKLRIGHDGKGSRPEWFLDKVEIRNMDTGDLAVFPAKCWFSKSKEDGKLSRDLVAVVGGKEQVKTTTYKVHVKTSDVRGAGTDANVFVMLFGANGDSGELHLKESETNKDPFENNNVDTFTFNNMLSLGDLVKVRVWHDNKGFGAAWHCAHIEVEEGKSKKKFMFPCNRWLSKSEDDKQIIRELTCANPTTSPGTKEKITYEITVTTTDKKDAGMMHNGWVILEGDTRASKEFILENSAKNKVLRRGQSDNFTMVSRNLGKLERCIVGSVERDDRPLGSAEGRDAMWHCHEIVVKDSASGDKYVFPCKDWISIKPKISRKSAKVLELKTVEESKFNALKSLAPVKYEVLVKTGDVKGAGTDANVDIIIYGENGDTGKRPLKQRFRDLFEKNQVDKFEIEALDLGELSKIRIEHDNAGWGAGWFLDHVEIVNQTTGQKYTFPCGQWLDKKKGDGEICRELYARE